MSSHRGWLAGLALTVAEDDKLKQKKKAEIDWSSLALGLNSSVDLES